jgi:hypothetical protein
MAAALRSLPRTPAPQAEGMPSLKEHVELLVQLHISALAERLTALDRLTTERFVAFTVNLAAMERAQHDGIGAAKDAINVALVAADRAVTKAEIATEKRFESVNEFRGALNDQAKNLMTRAEVEQALRNITDKIEGPAGVLNRVETLRAHTGGREDATAMMRQRQQWSSGVLLSTGLGLMALMLSVLAIGMPLLLRLVVHTP